MENLIWTRSAVWSLNILFCNFIFFFFSLFFLPPRCMTPKSHLMPDLLAQSPLPQLAMLILAHTDDSGDCGKDWSTTRLLCTSQWVSSFIQHLDLLQYYGDFLAVELSLQRNCFECDICKHSSRNVGGPEGTLCTREWTAGLWNSKSHTLLWLKISLM